MIYLELFFTFLKIGAFAFGGGYGMVPVIRQEVLSRGWLDDSTLLEYIAISESTPGPIAVNLSTFVGSAQGGILGAACALVGVILPAFVIMLIIARVFAAYQDNKYIKAAFDGIRPTVTGLILATGLTLVVKSILPGIISTFSFMPDVHAVIIAALLTAEIIIYKKVCKKDISPILIIGTSAVFGAVVYSF